MAADDRLERVMSDRLHDWLDPVAGPHPRWSDSPAALAVAGDGAVRLPTRRVPRLGLLMAAAVALALLVAGLILAGGRTETHPPSITPDRGLVAPPSAEATETTSPRPASSDEAGQVSPGPAATPCTTRWSHEGTVDPRGQVDGIWTVELNGWDGHVNVTFGHSIDTVERISIAPADPSFVNESGRTVHVRGTAFFRLTLRGLTRRTWNSPADMIAGEPVGPFTRTVELPIAEMQRIRVPREALPNDGPKGDSTETWIIGLEQPACIDVQVMSLAGYSDDSQDNTIVVRFGPVPLPSG